MSALIDKNYIVFTYVCPDSGVVVSEVWKNRQNNTSDYLRHRTGGPAVIERDKDTGNITLAAHYMHDLNHRDHGQPSCEAFDKDGNLIWRDFQVHGQYNRPDNLPNFEKFDPETGHCVRAEYRIVNPRFSGFGKTFLLHRTDGPAVQIYDRLSGELSETQFYQNGRRRKNKDVKGPTL